MEKGKNQPAFEPTGEDVMRMNPSEGLMWLYVEKNQTWFFLGKDGKMYKREDCTPEFIMAQKTQEAEEKVDPSEHKRVRSIVEKMAKNRIAAIKEDGSIVITPDPSLPQYMVEYSAILGGKIRVMKTVYTRHIFSQIRTERLAEHLAETLGLPPEAADDPGSITATDEYEAPLPPEWRQEPPIPLPEGQDEELEHQRLLEEQRDYLSMYEDNYAIPPRPGQESSQSSSPIKKQQKRRQKPRWKPQQPDFHSAYPKQPEAEYYEAAKKQTQFNVPPTYARTDDTRAWPPTNQDKGISDGPIKQVMSLKENRNVLRSVRTQMRKGIVRDVLTMKSGNIHVLQLNNEPLDPEMFADAKKGQLIEVTRERDENGWIKVTRGYLDGSCVAFYE